MTTILVTGGAGYIGSHACKALAKAGYTPVAYDNLVYGHEWAVKWGPFEKGDILGRARLNEVINTYRLSAVMHFAANAYVGESVENPAKYYRNNVAGTLTLLNALRDNDIDKLIFSSTCATYGIPETLPIPDHHPQTPVNPYGFSKLMIEQILRDFDKAYNLRSISLRYFNAAGADQECQIGEDHEPETHLIPLVLDTAARNRTHITIFGNDYETPDGSCIRDYIHVDDLAVAHVLTLKSLERGATSTAYNLGNGKGFSVKEVIDVAQNITGVNIPINFGERRLGAPPYLVGDARRAQSKLKWYPRHTSLESIIQTAWDWHLRKQDILYK